MRIDTNKRSIVYRSSYSLNLMAWMMSYDIKIKLCKDANGKIYGMWEKNEHTEQLRHEYIIFEWLHKYLECFKEIKKESNELG